MDSDDSRDSSSSDSDANIGTERPLDSPDSVDSYGTGPMSLNTGPKSPSHSPRLELPRGPRSPPECFIESPSPDDRSQSANSIADSRNSIKSPMSRRSISSDRDSIKSNESIKSRGSDKSVISNKSIGSDKSTGSRKSRRSNKSVRSDKHSIKSPDSDKSCSPRLRSVESRSSQKSNDSCGPRSKSPSSDRELNRRSKSPSSDRGSVVSAGSIKSQSSGGRSPRSPSPSSIKSLQRNEDGNTSDSSVSSQDSSRRRKSNFLNVNSSGVPLEEQAEEISDAEMELDAVKDSDHCNTAEKPANVMNMNISHEDLSDVSDLESMGERSEEENNVQSSPPQKNSVPSPVPPPRDLRQKLDEAKNRKLVEVPKLPEKTSKTEDGEEALDFEAEDGECDPEPARPEEVSETQDQAPEEGEEIEKEKKKEEEPEEGEVTDDDEARPEETEPRPVCRFYSRGQCTWGASCRFLHPGVTDKGNYTMFEMIRPVVPGPPIGYGGGPDYRDERPVPFGHPIRPAEVPVAESAWERGLRTAKEMVRRAIKRKEQDMDFEEKKMNLTLSQDELDKENGYYTRAPSPILIEPSPPPVKHYVRHQPTPVLHDPYYGPHPQRHPQEEYYRRIHHFEPEPPPARQVRIEPEYDSTAARDRVRTYRELPAHRMPDYYNDKYEERTVTISSGNKRHSRPKREVIVQRMEPGSSSRGDEWADPWMRSKSPGGRRTGTRRQSYSSGSSYSSSSSSRSSSASSRSSYRRTGAVHHSRSQSRSVSPRSGTRRHHAALPDVPSPHGIGRHRNIAGHATHERRGGRTGPETGTRRPRISPSVIVSERRAAHERALLMNPPAPSPRKAHRETRPPSPGMMRTSAQNPPAPIKVPSTDQFGRTTKRELAMERRQLDPDRKKLVVAAALAARVKSRAVRSSRSSSGSDSSGSSSSDSESSYSSSSSSHEGSATSAKRTSDNRMELAAFALKAKAIDALKGDRVPIENKKRPAQSPPAEAPAPKIATLNKTTAVGPGVASAGGKKQTSRREELLKQLKAVEDAIAKKRSKVN